MGFGGAKVILNSEVMTVLTWRRRSVVINEGLERDANATDAAAIAAIGDCRVELLRGGLESG